jgi:hypothetical protein
MHKRRTAVYTLLILGLTLLQSCGQGNKMTLEYFVNEDGSGKVEIDYESELNADEKLHHITSVDQFLKEESVGQSYLLNKQIKKIIEESDGVSRWDNVKYSFTEDKSSSERYSLKATAYFKDITEVDLEGIPDLEVSDFSKEGLKWSFPLKNSDNKKVDQLSKEQSLLKTKMLFSFLGSSLKVAFDRGLELNYIYNLPKKIKSSGTFKKSESNNRRAEFLFTEEYMNENAGRMKEVFESNKDSLVVPIDLINEVLFGSEEEKKIKMASGLFSGKAKNYVDKDEITAPSDFTIDPVELPEIKNFQDLIIDYRGHLASPDKYKNITGYTSKIYADKNEALYTGIVFAKEARTSRMANISEVKNGELDGAYWGFEDRDLSYKTQYQEGIPAFETKLFRKGEPNKKVEAKTLEIKKKWSPLENLTHIEEDAQHIWFAGDLSKFNLIRINKDTKDIKVFNELNTPIHAKLINNIVVDDQNIKWVGTDNGLYTYSEGNWEKVSLDPIYEKESRLKKNSFIEQLAFNPSDKSIWFLVKELRQRGSENMIQIDSLGNFIDHTEKINNENKELLGYIKFGPSIKFHENKLGLLDHTGSVWIYNYMEGQEMMNKLKNKKGYNYVCRDFVFDEQGRIWTVNRREIRCFDNDLKSVKAISNENYDGLQRIGGFTIDVANNIIHFGARTPRSRKKNKENIPSDYFIVSYNIGNNEAVVKDLPEGSTFLSAICKTTDNKMWFLNQNGKIIQSNHQLSSFEELEYYNIQKLPKFFSLEKDKNDKIIITVKGGKAYELDESSDTWNSFEPKTPNSLEGEIISSSTERWFIPFNEDQKSLGIYFWEKEKWNQQDLPQSIRSHTFARGIINDKGLFLVFKPKERNEEYKVVYLNDAKEWNEIKLPFENADRITIGHSKNTLWVYKQKEGLFKLKNNNEWMGFSGSDEWSYVLSIHDAGKGELILSFDGYILIKTAKHEFKKYNFLNSGIVFGRATGVIRDKDDRIMILFESNSESSSMENSDMFTSNLMIYDKGNWKVLLDGSENVSGNIYDFHSVLLKNGKVFLGTRHNGILKAELPK